MPRNIRGILTLYLSALLMVLQPKVRLTASIVPYLRAKKHSSLVYYFEAILSHSMWRNETFLQNVQNM
jgi:hypothetical protein